MKNSEAEIHTNLSSLLTDENSTIRSVVKQLVRFQSIHRVKFDEVEAYKIVDKKYMIFIIGRNFPSQDYTLPSPFNFELLIEIDEREKTYSAETRYQFHLYSAGLSNTKQDKILSITAQSKHIFLQLLEIGL